MRFLRFILLCAIVIGTLMCSACISSPGLVYKPDVSTTGLMVHYTGPVHAKYGTYDCIFNNEVMAPTEIRFNGINCRMDYAYFGKTANDTGSSVLIVDLVRDGQVIKNYTTSTSSIGFEKIPEFLVRSTKEPDLMQDTPLSANILVDREWNGWFKDTFGTQLEYGSGPASMTLLHPALPVEACVNSKGGSAGTPPVVEIYRSGTFLKRSDAKNDLGYYCVTYP